jgi:hypothetical protein
MQPFRFTLNRKRAAVTSTAARKALVQKVTFKTTCENYALSYQRLPVLRKAICDILHQWIMNVWLTTNDENGGKWCSEEKSPPSRYQLEPLFSRESPFFLSC